MSKKTYKNYEDFRWSHIFEKLYAKMINKTYECSSCSKRNNKKTTHRINSDIGSTHFHQIALNSINRNDFKRLVAQYEIEAEIYSEKREKEDELYDIHAREKMNEIYEKEISKLKDGKYYFYTLSESYGLTQTGRSNGYDTLDGINEYYEKYFKKEVENKEIIVLILKADIFKIYKEF